MDEQVVDISETLKYLASELNSMRQNVDSQHAEICQLNRKIEAQSKEIRTFKKENFSLQKRLSKHEQPSKDNNKSSIPPSKENIKSETIRRTRSLRKKSDKPVGGQLGHEGHTRKIVDLVDQVIDHSSHYCHNCGRYISGLVLEKFLKNITAVTDRHGRILRFGFQRPPNLFSTYF